MAGEEIWRSDGTIAGTTILKDIVTSSTFSPGSNPGGLSEFGNKLVFYADEFGIEERLWASDGTEAGTVVIGDIPFTREMEIVGNTIFYVGESGSGLELWKSDGSVGGDSLVRDIDPGSSGSNLAELTNVDGTLYFIANDGFTGLEIWKSNGKEIGNE